MRGMRYVMAAGLAVGLLASAAWAQDAPAKAQPGRPVRLSSLVPAPAAPARKVKVTFLGVVTSPAGETLGQHLKLPEGTGLVVEFVQDDSPAAKAGLARHDVLVRLDDQILVNPEQLAVLVRIRKPGDKVGLAFIRSGKEEKAAAELGEHEQVIQPLGAGRVFVRPLLPPNVPGGLINLGPPAAASRLQPAEQAGLHWLLTNPSPALAQPGAAAMASASMSDGQHTINVTLSGSGRYLVATDAAGKVVFSGPIDTPDQLQAVPPEIRAKLGAMQVQIRVQQADEADPDTP